MNTVRITRSMENPTIRGKRILLVDDEQEARESVQCLLAMDHHTVVHANNGAEALWFFAQEQFDLVVTDFEIPFMRGNELAARIREMAPKQPILMITGHSKRPGPANPVDAVLTKPVGWNQLRTAMAELLCQKTQGGVGDETPLTIAQEGTASGSVRYSSRQSPAQSGAIPSAKCPVSCPEPA